MANPQCEDGYTRIANELLEAMCRLRLSGIQWQVLHTIIRKTYGWNKTEDWLTTTQIADMTELARPRVSEALKVLQQRRVILRDRRRVGVQKDHSMWIDHAKVTQNRTRKSVRKTVNGFTQNRTESVRKTVHTKDKRHCPKDRESALEKLHPAVRVYAEITGKVANEDSRQYQAMVKSVGDSESRLERWRKTVEGWKLNGYRDDRLGDMLDAFTSGRFVGNRKLADDTVLGGGGVM